VGFFKGSAILLYTHSVNAWQLHKEWSRGTVVKVCGAAHHLFVKKHAIHEKAGLEGR